jgi:SPP1 gp7 family putative phage head morphogenesis protein
MSTTGPSGPERDEAHGSHHLTPVERMAQAIASDIARLEDASITPLIPVLLDAQRELEAGLAEWLSRVGGDQRYGAQEHRRGLVAVRSALDAIGQMRPEIQQTLLDAMSDGAALATGHLRTELERFGRVFGHSVGRTQITTAAIIARAKSEIIPRIRTSSARYVEAVRADMRHQLAVGLAKGETFTQMTNRLRRLGGPRGLVALRGIAGEPGAYAEEIAEGLFTRYRHWAERVVRTEVINAYNVEHAEGIAELNATREHDDDELLYKWDSSTDRRVCPLCLELDGEVRKEGKEFAPGVDHPPSHPNCRCVVVAWHPSWGGIKGEHPPKNAAPVAKPSKPRARTVPAAEHAASAAASGDFAGARTGIERDLGRRNLAETTRPAGKQTLVQKLPAGVLGQHNSLTGRIAITPDTAAEATRFGKEFAADPDGVKDKFRALSVARRATKTADPAGHHDALDLEKRAQGMHVLVHEAIHGYGPMLAGQYQRVDAKVEEVATEVLARRVMRERFGVPFHPDRSLAAYEKEVQRTVGALAEHFKVSRPAAAKLLEKAAQEYKRIPMPSSAAGAPRPVQHLARAVAKIQPNTSEVALARHLEKRLGK